MQKMIVKTSFGYIKDAAGHIISKAQLPAGEHPLKDGFDYIEVNSQAELDAIEIYRDPKEIQKAINEKKISVKIRQTAIDELKAAGELPADFED